MQRYTFEHSKLHLSYLDSARNGPILIALHSHWMEGVTFEPLANELAPQWRVIALDQRGHGYSDHAQSYTREDYLGDLEALFWHLNLEKPAVLLGNSLGGINAYQFAARHPNLVRALIIEDIGVEISVDVDFTRQWKGTFNTPEELAKRIGSRLLPYLEDSFRQMQDGWKLAFDPEEMIESNHLAMGDYWQDWLQSTCPALLLRGQNSRLTDQAHFEAMAAQRPNTQLQVLEGGHVIHFDNPHGFTESIKNFLNKINYV